MARLTFPSDRLVYSSSSYAGTAFASVTGSVATVYSDAAGTILADVQNFDGSANATATFTVDTTSRLPLFLGPAAGTDTLYIKVGTGPVTAIYAVTAGDISAAVGTEVTNRTAADAAHVAASNPHSVTPQLIGAPTVVVHGSTAGTARPTGATVVYWIGSVAPTNVATNDEWTDTANKILKRWNGASFDSLGSAASVALVPGWTASTAYTAGQHVVAPYGSHITAKATFTSGTSFTAANWNFIGTIDVRDFGVVADNTGNYTTQMQAAIDAAVQTIPGLTGNDAPAAIVQCPAGRIKTNGLTLHGNVMLRGAGRSATYLTSVSLTTGAMLSLTTGNEVQVTVRDIGIILNNGPADGISFLNTGGASILGDGNHHIENVVVVGGQRALQLWSNTECRVINLMAYRQSVPLGLGAIQIDGTDQMVQRCTVAQVQYIGTGQGGSAFRCNTSNSRFVDCKAFGGNATVNGTQQEAFMLNGYRNQVIGLEVQDYAGAIAVNAGQDNTFIGGTIDSCQGGGLVAQAGGPLVRGMRFLNRPGGQFTMPFALQLPDNTGADIDCTLETVPSLFDTAGRTGMGNRVRANGEGSTQAVAYALTVTPDPLLATYNQITLTGNITLANPVSAITNSIRPGLRVGFLLTQDATGGRTVSWAASYVVNNAPSTSANAVSRIEFEYDGIKWRETSPAGGGSGGTSVNVVSKTTTYTAANGDVVLANATTAAFAVTTPSSVVNNKITVKKTDSSANGVTITPASGTIDGAANLVLSSQYVSRDVVCDGTNWFVV